MHKAKSYDLEGSNVEDIGSDADKAQRHAAAMTEEMWEGAGKAAGLEIWRVENKEGKFGIKRWPKEDYGTFFRGDSYICLHTKMLPRGENGGEWDIHFWIGTQSTADEYCVAAYKTVELDDLLGGGPVQCRQMEGCETPAFIDIFSDKGLCPGGLRYLDGGIASGFRHVTTKEYEPRLLHVRRDNKSTKATEVPCTFGSLNQGDSFILDSGSKLFIFRGKESDGFEKMKAAELAKKIESDRCGKSAVVDAEDDAEFFSILGGGDSGSIALPVKKVEKAADDGKTELYSMDDDSRTYVKVADGPLDQSQLCHDDVMIVIGGGEVFVAVGPKAPREEKACAMFQAQVLIKQKGMNAKTPITRLITGMQPPINIGSKWQACFA